ncbi:outer membrane assembly protein AsmA [Affinibrenneria salicis]|uniref:Outer membrane assembly protein AsmA n=1 Tax=Affinibrenneria salicis TaxID=2590031 RepID=A0A5J5G0A5_9GAMM|nr:outer membrane assembly protein AsmA [Affinibrenneria salicis]KAA8999865.1 outer membrane assembly protein AsmA [Affinibrenneria salicis]
MRRFLTTLVILLVVLVAGMTALVALVNPNDFRAYMVRQVEERSGYQLSLEGDLRWHVWPQLSILSGKMSLQAPGASLPVVSADNMRLDVKLWPLLSHQLVVKQVLLKGAVARLTPESAAPRPTNAPVAPSGSFTPQEESGWTLDIDRLKIADSLLIFQRSGQSGEPGEQINVRDINLEMEQDGERQVKLTVSSRINRDQRDFTFSLAADMDMQHYPQQVSAQIASFDYQLQGAAMPAEGIHGQGSLQVSYQRQPERIEIRNLALSANSSQLRGDASVQMATPPTWTLNLTSDKIDLDALLGLRPSGDTDSQNGQKAPGKPVIAAETSPDSAQALRGFNAQLSLQVKELLYRGVTVNQLALQAKNDAGRLTVSTLSGLLGDGQFSLTAQMDVDATPAIAVQPVLKNIELARLLQALALPQNLSGILSMQGQLSGNELSLTALSQQWRGSGRMEVTSLRAHGLNIQQMIQQAIARGNGNIQAQERYERYTEMQQVSALAQLNAGDLRMTAIKGSSPLMQVTGSSRLDLPGQRCDINLNVRVLQGWRGDARLIEVLQNSEIPLRVYGPWNNLSYQLQVDQLLRKRLQDEVKKRLNDWADKNQQQQKGKDLKQLLERL